MRAPNSTPTIALRLIALLFVAGTFVACNNERNTPFPEEDMYAQPKAVPIQFGPEEALKWPEKGAPLTSAPARFDYDNLPSVRFDSAGFKPFRVPPLEGNIDWNKLPAADFNYDSLPEIPLRFKTSVLPPPEITKVNRPVLKGARPEMVFDFGDQLNGTPIKYVYKGKNGFTWIATARGIYRYDGENLALYSIDEFSASINDILEDQDGKIWITSRSGLYIVDVANGVVQTLSLAQGLITDFTVKLLMDQKRRIWVSCLPQSFTINKDSMTGGSVAIIDQAAKTIKLLRHAQGLLRESPTGMIEDESKNIWIATVQGGLNIIDLKNNRIRYLGKAQGLSTDTLTGLDRDHLGRIWATGVYGAVNIIDPGRNSIKKIDEQQGLPRVFIFKVVEDREGNCWIAADKFVTIIDKDLRGIKTLDRSSGLNGDPAVVIQDGAHQMLVATSLGLNILSKDAQAIRKIGSAQVSTQLEDSHGRIWIGTLEKGIQILDTTTGMVRIYDKAHGLSDNLIQYLVEYNGRIILSTQTGGIEIIDTSLQRIERIGATQGLTSNLTTIEKDKHDNIWLGGIDQGIKVLDLAKKQMHRIAVAEGLKDSAIIDIKRDSKGRMWLYSWTNGVGVIDVDKMTVRHIVKSGFKSLTGAREDNLLTHDSRGNTWLITSVSGIYMINAAGDSVTRFTIANGLLSNVGQSLREYQGKIYVGTGRGVNILTPPVLSTANKWEVESIGRSNGLVKTIASYNSDMILSNGQYWWGDDGITIIKDLDKRNRDSLVPATAVTGFDVLNRPQFFINDPWKNINDKDTIWKSDGFYAGRRSNAQMPLLDRRGMQWDSLSPLYLLPINLHLAYNQNYLQFRFAQAHLGTQDTVWYRYILEGVDQKWSEKTNKVISENYPNVPPGHYTFKVASLYRGKWGPPAEFSFIITPPWWNTWWAWLLYTLIAIGILRAYIAYRSRRLLRENKVLEEKVTLRTTQLQTSIEELKATQSQLIQSEKMASLGELTAGIAHEIQNPLNFINNFSEINKELLTDMKDEIAAGNSAAVVALADDIIANEEKINHHGRRADGIVKSMLQHSRSNQHAIKEPTDINKLADEYLRLAYHGLRAKDKSFNATLKTDFDQSIGTVNIMANDMGRVILNLITNAFYAVGEKKKQQPTGFDPTVSVFTRKSGGKIQIEVRDNANGIPQKVLDKIFQPFFTTKPAGQGTGLGLSLAYDIVKAHGGELKVDTKDNEGTSFIIILPI